MLQTGKGIEPISFLDEADAEILSSGPYAFGAVSAATLDIFGPDLAMMDLIATRDDVRGKGHARDLVAHIERALSSVGVQSLLIAVSSTDQGMQDVWGGGKKGAGVIGKGFIRMNRSEVGRLKSQWPHFSAAEGQGSKNEGPVYFQKHLRKER